MPRVHQILTNVLSSIENEMRHMKPRLSFDKPLSQAYYFSHE